VDFFPHSDRFFVDTHTTSSEFSPEESGGLPGKEIRYKD
jgi:hypothetical protein